MLTFSDFAKLYGAYETYVKSVTPTPVAPVIPASQPVPAPIAQPIVQTPVAQIAPTTQAVVEANNAQHTEYQDLISRISALENRAPQPSLETPTPATVDDIILGLIGVDSQGGGK